MSHTTRTILERDTPASGFLWLSRLFTFRTSGGILLPFLAFWFVASLLIIASRSNSGYYLKQYITQPIHGRVDFAYFDKAKLTLAQQRARELEPRVYRANKNFSWNRVQEKLHQLPDMVTGRNAAELPEAIRRSFDAAALNLLAQYAAPERRALYTQRADAFITGLRKLVIIPADQRDQEVTRQVQWGSPSGFAIRARDSDGAAVSSLLTLERVHAVPATPALVAEIARTANDCFREDLAPQIAEFTRHAIQATHVLDDNASQEAQEKASLLVPKSEGEIHYKAGVVIKQAGEMDETDLGILQAEHKAYRASLDTPPIIRDYLGIAGFVAVLTMTMAWYIRRYQPRIMRNQARALALALILLGTMLLSQLAGPGTRPLHIFGIAPTILTAIILAMAYEPHFALGISLMLASLTALGLNQDISFLMVLLAGCFGACAFTSTVRTRGRLIEIGLASALFMVATSMFMGVWAFRGHPPFAYVLEDSLHAGLAGLASGFAVLGILPFIEKAFRITTGMTLVELSDASNFLQRMLAAEAPGTYSHSLQVATLAEAAAEAIGANSLLTRVGALYHDIGKCRRSHYFCENQSAGGNAHLSLSPEVSFMIIVEHIKDGIELAKQHNLPTAIYPFIQQHHGTTLVEYFYHEACMQQRPNQPKLLESDFRYPGPKPRSREIAIVMLADCCESAARALEDPTPEAIEKLVHTIAMKRLTDGQFSDCDLTLHELDVVEKTLTHTLQSTYHSRVAYPAVGNTSSITATGT